MASLISVDIKASGDEKQRYKMPTILTKTESGGNGVKTIFANIEDVAAAIFREADVLHKYFGYELGAQATYVAKENKYLVMGEFPAEILQKKVFEFIEKFVLCSKCRCPETDVEAGPKGRTVVLRCRACGTGHTAQANEKMTPLLLKYANKPTTDAKKVRNADASSSSAAAAYIGERPDIVFPSLSDEIRKQQEKVLDDVYAVVTNPTLPRDQVAQELVNIRKKAQFNESDLPRMIVRGAVRNATSSDIIQCLRVAAPQLQLLTARQDADANAAATTKTPAYSVILEEVIYLSMKADVKFAIFRIPMVLRMLVEEGVLEPQYVKEFHDNHTNPKRPKYYEKMVSRMSKYGFSTQDMEDLTKGMAALKAWMGWEDDKVEESAAAETADSAAVAGDDKKDKKEKKEKKEKSDKKEKKDKKSAKVEI